MAETQWPSQSASFGTDASTTHPSTGKRVQQAATRIGRSAVGAVDSGRSSAARRLHTTAESLRSASVRLPGGPKVQHFASRTADGLDRTARYLREKQAKDIWSDVRAGTKTHPVPFLVGALALGIVVGRSLRRR